MLHTSNPIKAVIAATPTTRIECSLFLRVPAAPALRRLTDDPTCMILPAPSSHPRSARTWCSRRAQGKGRSSPRQPPHHATWSICPRPAYHTAPARGFSSRHEAGFPSQKPAPRVGDLNSRQGTHMQQQSGDGFGGIDEARRVLGDVFAPWVRDLNLSIEAIDHDPPAEGATDWQPGAILRMPFSERLC